MRTLDECLAEMTKLIHEARTLVRERGEDAVGWEVILGLLAAEIEATYRRESERYRWGNQSFSDC
jgi:hypothetical protein